jgi:hypothetical protein
MFAKTLAKTKFFAKTNIFAKTKIFRKNKNFSRNLAHFRLLFTFTFTSVGSCTKDHSLWHCERKIIWVFRVECIFQFSRKCENHAKLRQFSHNFVSWKCSFSRKFTPKIPFSQNLLPKSHENFAKIFPKT